MTPDRRLPSRAPAASHPAELRRPVAIIPRTPERSDAAAHAAGAPTAVGIERRPVPLSLVVLAALAGAVCLGAMGHAAGTGTFRGSWEFSRLGGPWLIAGFAGGAVGGWRRGGSGLVLGALTGAWIVGAGSVAYYGLSFWAGEYNARSAAKLGIGWGAAGLGVGAVLGLLGAACLTALGRRPARGGRWRASWIHGAALGTLGGLLVGEAVALLVVWDGQNLRAMATLEGLGGIALVLAGCTGRAWRFVVAAVAAALISAAVAPIAASLLRETLRAFGWAGA